MLSNNNNAAANAAADEKNTGLSESPVTPLAPRHKDSLSFGLFDFKKSVIEQSIEIPPLVLPEKIKQKNKK